MRVLVVGGTGPTGPHVVDGLLARGHTVTIFHRGFHEPPHLADVEHLHGDPHFRASIDETINNRSFDLVLAMYGRVKHLAAALPGRCWPPVVGCAIRRASRQTNPPAHLERPQSAAR